MLAGNVLSPELRIEEIFRFLNPATPHTSFEGLVETEDW
jgi:hypothetical protein